VGDRRFISCASSIAGAVVQKELLMAGRGPQSFKKRQKEQQRKEKQQEKAAKRVQRKTDKENGVIVDEVEENDELEMDNEESAEEIAARIVGLRLVDRA
jgi:hypothetical protein